MNRNLSSLLLAATCLAGGLVQPAWAQNGEDQDQVGLGDIVVTATKVESNLQDVPISIIVQDGQKLRNQNVRRLDEALASDTSIQIQETQVGPQFYIRGIGQNTGIPSPTNQQPVALYVDGVYQPRNEYIRGGMLDVQRLEVLRGPQGTLLGGAAYAGAVSMVTWDPQFDNEAKFTVGAGNLDDRTAELVGNVKLSDTFALRVAGSSNVRKGYYSSGLEDSNSKVARVKLRWQPNDAFNVVTSAEYIKIGGIGPGQGSLSDTFDSDGNDTGILHYFRQRRDAWDDGTPYGQSGGAPLGFRNTTLKGLSAVASYDFDNFATLTAIPSIQTAKYISSEALRGPQRNGENRKQDTHSVEVRLNSDPSHKISWLVGAYYYHTSFGGSFIQETVDLTIPGGPPVTCPGTAISCVAYNYADGDDLTSKSVFGNVTVPLLNERLRLTGGIRYSHDKTRLNETAPTGNATAPTGTTAEQYLTLMNPTFVEAFDTSSKVTYLGAAEFDITDKAMVYARYAEGYKKGNVQLSFTGGLQFQRPQILTDRAIGLKSRWFDDKLQVNVEYFNSYYDDYAISVCSPLIPGGCGFPLSIFPGTNVSVATNYPKVISRGFDVNIDLKPTRADFLQFSVSRLTSKFAKASDLTQAQLDSATSDPVEQAALQSVFRSYEGATLQNSPKWSFNASYEHRFDLGDLGELSVRGEWVHKTSSYSNLQGGSVPNDPVSVQPTYSLWNASTTYTTPDGNYSLTGYVRNIGNYPVMTNYSTGYADLAAPRLYGITLSGKF